MGIFDWFRREKKQFVVEGGGYHVMPLATWLKVRDAIWTGPTYKAFMEAFLEKNDVVSACIHKRGGTLGGVPIKAYTYSGNEPTEIEDGPIVELLEEPNPYYSMPDLLTEAVMHWDLGGNVFIRKIKVGGEVRELWLLRPDLVEADTNAKGIVTRWKYRPDPQKDPIPYKPEEIIHIRAASGRGGVMGAPIFGAASRKADMHNSIVEQSTALFQNGFQPGSIVNLKAEDTTDEDTKALEERLNKKLGGPENSGKMLVVSAQELDIKPVSWPAKDTNVLEFMDGASDGICSVLGVPPELIGRPAKFANYSEARKAFYNETIIPLARKFEWALTRGLAREFGDDVYIEFDFSEVPELQEDMGKTIPALAQATGGVGFMTPAEAREWLGLDAIKSETGVDVLYGSPTAVPITGPDVPTPGLEEEEPDEEESDTPAGYRRNEGR